MKLYMMTANRDGIYEGSRDRWLDPTIGRARIPSTQFLGQPRYLCAIAIFPELASERGARDADGRNPGAAQFPRRDAAGKPEKALFKLGRFAHNERAQSV